MSSNTNPQRNPNNEIAKLSAGKKNKKKLIIIPLVLILVAVVMFILWPANVSRQEAQEIAIAHVGNNSRANPASRDFERFQRVWSVEVFYDGLVHEVYVSMRTGEVVRMEIDRWD